jgi:hypothetical protein
MNASQNMEFLQELKRPWINFPRILALYGFAWLAGAAGLTALHVVIATYSPPPADNLHKTGVEDDAPKITPPVLPGGLPSRLISTLPSGTELTLMDVNKWNQNVVAYARKAGVSKAVLSDYQDLITVKGSKLPSLGQKQSTDTNFLSVLGSLPIMSPDGKIVGVLDSKQLKEIKNDKGITYLSTRSLDVGEGRDQYGVQATGWRTTFLPKDRLLDMKVIEYTWSKADPKVPSGVSTEKQYFLLDAAH